MCRHRLRTRPRHPPPRLPNPPQPRPRSQLHGATGRRPDGSYSGAAAATTRVYKEAPTLAQLVKDGKLPPVEKRLPDNPRVIKPLEETGQYGGVWRRAFLGSSDYLAAGKLMEARLIAWEAPDPNTLRVVPSVIEKWEQSSDATIFTFYLRKGLKWSDGADVTTDDVKFWWEDIQQNPDLTPTPAESVRQKVGSDWKLATVTILDPYTWKVQYAAPYPLLPIWIAKNGGNGGGPQNVIFPAFLAPRGYLKQFLPKYASKEALDRMAQDRKLQSWVDLWGKGGQTDGPIGSYMFNADLPVLTAWKPERTLPDDPDPHGPQSLLLPGRRPGQSTAVYRHGRALVVPEQRSLQALDCPGQDRLPAAQCRPRRVHVLQGERSKGRLPGLAVALGQHVDVLPEPEHRRPGAGRPVRQGGVPPGTQSGGQPQGDQ